MISIRLIKPLAGVGFSMPAGTVYEANPQEALQAESDVPTVEVLDRAVAPSDRTSPNRKLTLLLGFLLFSVAGVIWILFKAYRSGDFQFTTSE